MGRLYILDEIGESEHDLTVRAVRILRGAAFAAACDPAWLRQALDAYGITTAVLGLSGGVAQWVDALLAGLQRGDGVWVCGPEPGCGWRVVRTLAGRGAALVSLPGPARAVAALAASGLSAARVTFLGTLPAAAEDRRRFLRRWAAEPATLVARAPEGAVGDLFAGTAAEMISRRVALCCGDETWRRAASDAASAPWLPGPCELVMQTAPQAPQWPLSQVRERIAELLQQGGSPRDVTRLVAESSGWARRKIYEEVLRAASGPRMED